MSNPNIDPVALVRVCAPLVPPLIAARAVFEVEREKADALQRELLLAGNYMPDASWPSSQDGERITEPKRSFLMGDADAKEYFAKLDAAWLAAGYTGLAPGECPALIAQCKLNEAERALIDAAEPITGIPADRIFLEKRQRYVELLIGLTFSSPPKKLKSRR